MLFLASRILQSWPQSNRRFHQLIHSEFEPVSTNQLNPAHTKMVTIRNLNQLLNPLGNYKCPKLIFDNSLSNVKESKNIQILISTFHRCHTTKGRSRRVLQHRLPSRLPSGDVLKPRKQWIVEREIWSYKRLKIKDDQNGGSRDHLTSGPLLIWIRIWISDTFCVP